MRQYGRHHSDSLASCFVVREYTLSSHVQFTYFLIWKLKHQRSNTFIVLCHKSFPNSWNCLCRLSESWLFPGFVWLFVWLRALDKSFDFHTCCSLHVDRWIVRDKRRLSTLRQTQRRLKRASVLPGSASWSPRSPTRLRPHHSNLHLYPAAKHVVHLASLAWTSGDVWRTRQMILRLMFYIIYVEYML